MMIFLAAKRLREGPKRVGWGRTDVLSQLPRFFVGRREEKKEDGTLFCRAAGHSAR